jgi:hypothetical protein
MRREVKDSIISLCARNKTFPSDNELVEYAEQSLQEVHAALDALCENRFIERLPSGQYVLNPGIIMRQSAVGIDPSKEPSAEAIPDSIADPFPKKKCKKEKVIKEKPEVKKEFDLVIPILRLLMLAIGTGAMIVSIFYTWIWLRELLPSPLAILLSTIMVCFSVLSFEVIVLFLTGEVTKHWSRWFVITGFSFLWIIVAAFSITSTIAGQYNKHIKNSKEYAMQNQGKKSEVMKWNRLQERKTELVERRLEKKTQISNLIAMSNQVGTIAEAEKHNEVLASTNYRTQTAESELNHIEAELEKVRDEEKKAITADTSLASADTVDVPDFYSWLAKILDIKKDLAQFWLSLFPAIFVDLISPAALAIAAFLKKK